MKIELSGEFRETSPGFKSVIRTQSSKCFCVTLEISFWADLDELNFSKKKSPAGDHAITTGNLPGVVNK